MGLKEDIDMLDTKIARLKVEYEQYFMRVLKREPAKLRDEIERIILQYSNKAISNTSLKFRYNATVARYNSYKQYWTRVLRAIEEGTYVRKAEGGAVAAGAGLPGGPAVPPEAYKEPPGREDTAPKHGAVKADPTREVYEKYIRARKECNEPTEGLSYEAVMKTIDKNIKMVEDKYKTRDVELKVYIKNGKAMLAITPKGK